MKEYLEELYVRHWINFPLPGIHIVSEEGASAFCFTGNPVDLIREQIKGARTIVLILRDKVLTESRQGGVAAFTVEDGLRQVPYTVSFAGPFYRLFSNPEDN